MESKDMTTENYNVDYRTDFLAGKKLKNIHNRKSKQDYGVGELAQEVAERTGFVKSDVLKVLQTFGLVAREKLVEGCTFRIPKLGMVSAVLAAPAKRKLLQYQAEQRGEVSDGIARPKFKAKFFFNRWITAELHKRFATQEEVDNLYED